MRIFYITLNKDDEARRISRALLEQQLAVCTNWFPITCAYRWEGKIVDEPETVLLVKTQSGYRQAIEEVVRQHINYTNLMAEISPDSVNESFAKWLNAEVPLAARGAGRNSPSAAKAKEGKLRKGTKSSKNAGRARLPKDLAT